MMKLSEIHVGGVYYYDPSTSWINYRSYRTAKVTIVDTGKWVHPDVPAWSRQPRPEPRPAKDGERWGVLVDRTYTTTTGEDTERTVAELRYLRGEWDATNALIESAAADRLAEARAMDEVRAAKQAVVTRLADFNLRGRLISGEITMSAGQLSAMLDELERHGWKYQA